jgi:hypothetical protein
MEAEWRETRKGISRDLSSRRCATGRYDAPWTTINGEVQGRMLCWKAHGRARIHWTTNHLRISAEMHDAGGHSAALYRDWQDAGPD